MHYQLSCGVLYRFVSSDDCCYPTRLQDFFRCWQRRLTFDVQSDKLLLKRFECNNHRRLSNFTSSRRLLCSHAHIIKIIIIVDVVVSTCHLRINRNKNEMKKTFNFSVEEFIWLVRPIISSNFFLLRTIFSDCL